MSVATSSILENFIYWITPIVNRYLPHYYGLVGMETKEEPNLCCMSIKRSEGPHAIHWHSLFKKKALPVAFGSQIPPNGLYYD